MGQTVSRQTKQHKGKTKTESGFTGNSHVLARKCRCWLVNMGKKPESNTGGRASHKEVCSFQIRKNLYSFLLENLHENH